MAYTPSAFAASFNVGSGQTQTTGQNLTGGENGTVESGGRLDVNGSAVVINGVSNKLNNHGTIDSDDDAIQLNNADDNSINNHGIVIADDDGVQLTNDSDNNVLNNYGSIEARNRGVKILDSMGNTVNNYGRIESTDNQGIWLRDGDNNKVNNYGSIIANDDGIRLNGGSSGNTINNYGTIRSGASGIDIIDGNGNNTINNNGKIFIDDIGGNFAITSGGQNNTLNLYSRSQIIGRIRMDGDDGDVVNVNFAKAATSSTLTFSDDRPFPTINLKNDNMVKIGDDFVAVVDPTGPSVQGEALGTLTDKIHGAITNHLLNGPGGPPQLASLSVQQGMVRPGKGDQIWVSGFGFNRERDEDGRALAYNHDVAGGVAGYEMSIGNFRVGGLAGYAHTDVVTDTVSSDTNTSSWFIGGYGRAVFGIINLDVALLAGYEQNDHDRWLVDNINGFEIAHGNFDSYFLSPSATVSSQFMVMDNIALRPSATASYSVAWYNSYTETGTTLSNLSIDSRSADAFVAKLQLGTAYIFSKGNEVEFRFGGRYRYTDDDDIEANLAGSSFQYAAVGDDENLEGYFGAAVRLAVKDWVSLTADMEHSINDIENTLSGQLGLEFTF